MSTAAGPRARLVVLLDANAAQAHALEVQHSRIVASADADNADDEHDPEGATLAFEREQTTALLDQVRRGRHDLELAIARVDAGTYGACEVCGAPIGAARLEARPAARTCIDCAS